MLRSWKGHSIQSFHSPRVECGRTPHAQLGTSELTSSDQGTQCKLVRTPPSPPQAPDTMPRCHQQILRCCKGQNSSWRHSVNGSCACLYFIGLNILVRQRLLPSTSCQTRAAKSQRLINSRKLFSSENHL